MTTFDQALSSFRALLEPDGIAVQPTGVAAKFVGPRFSEPIFAVPDVHLCDGKGGDIFLKGNPGKAGKLAATLRAIYRYRNNHTSRAIQLGDWFDIWRVCGKDPMNMAFGAIENAAVFTEILDWDSALGLPHVIGNHDAAFLNAIPNRRAAQPNFFRPGFWVGNNVYALHGHQTTVSPPAGKTFDQVVVHAATVLGQFVPGATWIQQFIDQQHVAEDVKQWLKETFTGQHEDVDANHRAKNPTAPPDPILSGDFVVRENQQQLLSLVAQVEAFPASNGRAADLVLVAHSHVPCVSWSSIGTRPVVIAFAGAWTYDKAHLLIAAGDTVAVFNIV